MGLKSVYSHDIETRGLRRRFKYENKRISRFTRALDGPRTRTSENASACEIVNTRLRVTAALDERREKRVEVLVSGSGVLVATMQANCETIDDDGGAVVPGVPYYAAVLRRRIPCLARS